MDEPRLMRNRHGQIAIELRRTPGNVIIITMMEGQSRGVKTVPIKEFDKEFNIEVMQNGLPYPMDMAAKRWLQADHLNLIKLSQNARRELQMIIGIKEGIVVGRLGEASDADAKRAFGEGAKLFKSKDDLKKLSLPQLVAIFNAACANETDKVEKFVSKEAGIGHCWAALEGIPLSEIPAKEANTPVVKPLVFYKAVVKEGDKGRSDSERGIIYAYLCGAGKTMTIPQLAEATGITEDKVKSAMNFLVKDAKKVVVAEEGEAEIISLKAKPTKEEIAAAKEKAKQEKAKEKELAKAAKEAAKTNAAAAAANAAAEPAAAEPKGEQTHVAEGEQTHAAEGVEDGGQVVDAQPDAGE